MSCGCNKGMIHSRLAERARIENSFGVFSIPVRERSEIIEALDSGLWDWYRDCDGCTLVSDVYWPNKFFPPCLRHDFDFATGQNGVEANERFYRIQRAYGMGRVRAAVRWLGVSAAWFSWFKWRNMMTLPKRKDAEGRRV